LKQLNPLSSPSNGLDWRAALVVPLRLFAPWLAIVLVVTWAGYPGVVCVTPMAWLLALRVGLVVAGQSSSPQPGQRLREAALAGALFGLLQGLLFAVLILRVGEILPGERFGAALMIALVLVFGILIGAALSLFTASQLERRQRAAS
jgi:uncharacterized membrane protein YedE/YeeE